MKNVIKARIKRNGLDVIAGDYFKDENSEIVKHLNRRNKKAIVGIQREDGIYTILGENLTYYLTVQGVEGEISHEDFLEILGRNAMKQGKKGSFEFVSLNDKDSVWLINTEAMNSMWNTIMFLHKLYGGSG